MALRAGAGYAFKGARSVRQQFSMVTRSGEALAPKICVDYCPSARIPSFSPLRFGGRRFSTKDSDSLLRDSIKQGVSKGLKEALGNMKTDGDSILRLSVVKSGVNAGVKESLKDYKVFIDFAEHDVDPVVKAAIEDAVVQGLNKFVNQVHKAPLNGEVMGPSLLKLALREGIKEGLHDIYNKFTLFVGRGMDLLIRELFLIKDQTKAKGNEDFIQVWFCGLVHKFLNKKVIWCVDKAWIIIPYVAGAYLFVLVVQTLIESKIPPWEYPQVLNCYRVHGLTSALGFYQKQKAKKKKAEEEAAGAWAAQK